MNLDDPDALLNRDEVAAKLRSAGYAISSATLAAMVSRGSGPRFSKFGNRVCYKWSEALAWAEQRTKGSTSKADRQPQKAA